MCLLAIQKWYITWHLHTSCMFPGTHIQLNFSSTLSSIPPFLISQGRQSLIRDGAALATMSEAESCLNEAFLTTFQRPMKKIGTNSGAGWPATLLLTALHYQVLPTFLVNVESWLQVDSIAVSIHTHA